MTKYNNNLIPVAKKLRENMTDAEKLLWYNFLKNHNVRFRRQKVIVNYIADFYCAKAKLVIEIDGKHHKLKDKAEQDDYRSDYLNALDIKVIRFTNDEIINNFNIVCNKINEILNKRL